MKRSIYGTILAALTSLSLVACQSGNGSGVVPANPFPVQNGAPNTTGQAVLGRIVGIGDSLTAGFQSGALLGVTGANPFFPATSPLPGLPPGQPVGWWADLFNQVNGPNAALNVLPLIKSPGIGMFLIPTNTGSFTAPQSSCGGLNAFAFDPAQTIANDRVNTALTTPLDLGVPGMGAHEALYMVGPQGPCAVISAGPFAVFQSENTNFYPVMANYAGLSPVQAARNLRPTLTTVWLGANEVLKYAGTGGQYFIPVSSYQADLTTIVQTLQAAGSQVALANLPDVLSVPAFIPVAALPLVLQGFGVPAQSALAISVAVSQANNLTAGSYYTLAALPAILAVAQGGAVPSNLVQLGQALPAAFAAQVQSYNTSINSAIASVAQATGAALVDIHATFVQAATMGVPINPPKCCTLTLTGGLTSFDGLHPSNTGYALIANTFISAINAKWGTTIPQVNVNAVYATDPYAPH